jgi:hypothetical protein
MVAIKAHFNGSVFVPDEPVPLRPGESVVVQRLEEAEAASAPDTSFLRKLNIHLDARSLREIANDPEFNLENS